jgi:predicted DsbA family dithiol-disulfide isomerase
MRLGPDTAPIKVVEFSDLVCPSCRAIYPDVKKLVSDNNGKIQVILRHRPLTHNPEHQMAIPAAFLAEYGAESGKGWAFVDEMYNHDISELQSLDAIFKIAKKVGIDVDAAKARMKDTDPDWKRVLRDLDTAEKIDVTQTPTFVVLGPGVPPTSALGHELLTTLQEPAYQAILKSNGN